MSCYASACTQERLDAIELLTEMNSKEEMLS